MAEKKETNFKVVADNRRARFDYEIGETFEAGMVLTGTEVKSLRTGKATIGESYASLDKAGEVFLVNAQYPRISAGQSLQPCTEAAAQTASEHDTKSPALRKGLNARA